MQVDVELLVPYKHIAKTGHVRVDMERGNLEDLLANLVRQVPALRDHLSGEEFAGALPFLLMINRKVVAGRRPADIRINQGDCVTITQIMTGG